MGTIHNISTIPAAPESETRLAEPISGRCRVSVDDEAFTVVWGSDEDGTIGIAVYERCTSHEVAMGIYDGETFDWDAEYHSPISAALRNEVEGAVLAAVSS